MLDDVTHCLGKKQAFKKWYCNFTKFLLHIQKKIFYFIFRQIKIIPYYFAFFPFLAGQDAENDDLKEVSEIYEIPVIHGDAWVLESIRCSKHLPVSFFEASPSKVALLHFFKGHVFSVSGLGSKDVNR